MNRARASVSPFFVPGSIANMASGLISMRYGARGPNSCVVTACTTGTHAIGEADRIIQRGDADVMVAGGAEAPVTALGLGGFGSMQRALDAATTTRSAPAARSTADRDGFVLGRGAGVVVLESLSTRGARRAIYAEIIGYGCQATRTT